MPLPYRDLGEIKDSMRDIHDNVNRFVEEIHDNMNRIVEEKDDLQNNLDKLLLEKRERDQIGVPPTVLGSVGSWFLSWFHYSS